MGDDGIRWYDAESYSRLTDAPALDSLGDEWPYNPAEGSAEAMLTTLLATWREEKSPLIFGDHPCKWLVISGTGPGDLRGYALPPGGDPYCVSVETKISSSLPLKTGVRGVVLSRFKKAIEQAVDGLKRSRIAYKADAERWLRLTPSPAKAAVVLAGDSWRVPPGIVDQAFREVLSEVVLPEFLGPQAMLRCAVIGVKRFPTQSRQIVRVEPLYDALLTPAG